MRLRVLPDISELAWWRKLVLAGEILGTYVRIRWLIRDENAVRAVPQIRGHFPARRQFAGTEEERRLAGLRLGHTVVRTLSPLPYDSRCLFRSLTLTALLQKRGIPSTVVIAVRPAPFAAHAWVEHDGRPLLEPGQPGFERIAEL
jgi:hypothetical protein